MSVYIFTRSRPDSLLKIMPRWHEQRIPVWLVVEPSEYIDHIKLRDEQMWHATSVLGLPDDNLGMGFARGFAVNHAKRKLYKSIIVSDDDIRPSKSSDMGELLYEAAKPGVLGVGAVHGLHDRFTGGAVTKNKGKVILCPGGWGFTLYALNVKNALRVGSYNPDLDAWGEDAELARNGIANGVPWRVHCGVWADYFSKRGDPGGMSKLCPTPEERAEREAKCQRIIHDHWPMYFSIRGARPRMAWQKMLDAYIPNWREHSAIHRGHL